MANFIIEKKTSNWGIGRVINIIFILACLLLICKGCKENFFTDEGRNYYKIESVKVQILDKARVINKDKEKIFNYKFLVKFPNNVIKETDISFNTFNKYKIGDDIYLKVPKKQWKNNEYLESWEIIMTISLILLGVSSFRYLIWYHE